MTAWPDHRLIDLFGIEAPIIQAPMAGANLSAMAIAVCEAGGLGSLPCALLPAERMREEIGAIRAATARPYNLNFFCHREAPLDAAREARWRERLVPFYRALGVDPQTNLPAPVRRPFDETACQIVEEMRPKVVSFHFGLPDPGLVARVKASGALVLSSATTLAEARWLEQRGCDAIIAQGAEAGGHRGMFLGEDVAGQVGTMALVPQIVDAVRVPVIASGGIAEARGILAALALGAAGVQLGTAYLFTPEAALSPLHRAALARAEADDTALTNLFTGRPARGIVNRLMRELGPICPDAPAFPQAAQALAPLRAKAEPAADDGFMPLWAGQALRLAREQPAGALTRRLAQETLALAARLRPV